MSWQLGTYSQADALRDEPGRALQWSFSAADDQHT